MRTKTKALVLATTATLLASGAVYAQKEGGGITPTPPGPGLLVPITGTSCNASGGINCPVALPDLSTVQSSFDISDCGLVESLDVGLDITHTWVSDMRITLESPAGGASTIIFDNVGCGGDDVEAMLSDSGASPVDSECAAAVPTIDGIFTPTNPLAIFNGEIADGTWTLTIEDTLAADEGTLNDWTLDLDCSG
ncbi:MAG: hypothetical protein HKP02_12890, partial [Xanthomonadales bacterium]|nr:hypothetical protein [Xanthomonadales bacterium]